MNILKKFLVASLALAGMAILSAPQSSAKKMSDLRIYINPGHGGYTSDDRPIRIYPFAQNDTLGYWESKSNLYKGLHMYHILDSLGAKPFLSRIKNTEDDDRSLSGIAAEANSLNVDLFFSIHSNAGENVNTPLMLYRENTIGTPRYPENVTLSKIVWKNLHSSQLPVWTRSTEYVCGDLTFYDKMWQGGLGVLRTLYVVGLLSEGSMHEHQPEAHRLMNDDYLWLEAWHFCRSIMEFFNTEDRFVTGNVAGVVYDDNNLREMIMPSGFSQFGRDVYAPLNGALVELVNGEGKVIQKRTTDNMYNGVFVFRNVTPGQYSVRVTHDGYYSETKNVTVTANEVSYQDMPMNMRREAPLSILAYSPNVTADQTVSCAASIEIDFSSDIDVPSFENAFSLTPPVDGYFTYSNSYRHVSFTPKVSFDLNTLYTVRIDASAKTADKYYDHPQMQQPLEFSFMTRGRNRLELIDNFPVDGGQVHYQSPTIELRFDNKIDPKNYYNYVSLKDAAGNEISINKRACKNNTLSNNYGNMQLIFSNLTPGQDYSLSLSGDLLDAEGLPLYNDFKLKFTAIDAASPECVADTVIFDRFEESANFIVDTENTLGTATTPTVIRSTSTKLFEKSAAKFSYKFADTHGGQAVYTYNAQSAQFNTGDKLGLYIYGDFNNHELYVGLASGTNIKYKKVCDLDYIGWRYQEVTLDNLEADFCPFLLREIKIVQKQSPITQNGTFAVDNLTAIAIGTGGVNDVAVDNTVALQAFVDGGNIYAANASSVVRLYTIGGQLITSVIPDANGNCRIAVSHLAHGIYLLTSGAETLRIAL